MQLRLTSQNCPVVVKLNLAGVCWFVCSIWAQWIVWMKYGPIDCAATKATHIMFVWRNNTANNPEKYCISQSLFSTFCLISLVFYSLSELLVLLTYQWSLQTNLVDLSVDNTSKETWTSIRYQCNKENWRSRRVETQPC